MTNHVRVLLCAVLITLVGVAMAAPIGVTGKGDSGATVCAKNSSGTTWCGTTVASNGTWTLTGASTGSNAGQALPTTGTLTFYQTNCVSSGKSVDRNDASKKFGGTWLNISCTTGAPAESAPADAD